MTEKLNDYIESLKGAAQIGPQVVCHHTLDGQPATTSSIQRPWPKAVKKALQAYGITSLYRHQIEAISHVREGRHVVVATPTASGKTLVYNLPVLEQVLSNPSSRALYLFPLKALAQDQKKAADRLFKCVARNNPTTAIYDGDTSAWHRKKIRQAPPNVLITNPEMLHLSLLPYHDQWKAFFSDLSFVVIDEVHSYRGILGANMACLLRRLHRVCRHYGSSPTFIFCSATVGNPADLSEKLTGLKVMAVTKNDAPRGRRHILLMDPLESPAQLAIQLLSAALPRRLRTIVYTQSRKLTELIAMWAQTKTGKYANKISAYRAGFLPEERREIESKLANGDLLAVISTSALELGIDIGDLDLCLLVGYPGTLVSTWQRGGRVGRGGQDAALILIAGEDALDQYFLHHPNKLLTHPPEAAVVNPENSEIVARHLPCAAAELHLSIDETFLQPRVFQKVIKTLEGNGDLLRSADGTRLFSRLKKPHRHVNLRGGGNRFAIIDNGTETPIGEIDGFRVFRETHPGAVYLHKGKTFLVSDLDIDAQTVTVVPAEVDYYTRVTATKETKILEVFSDKRVGSARFYTGRLRVTDQVTGYERRQIRGQRRSGRIPLDLPPQVFETEGLWFSLPIRILDAAEEKKLHFMGGIHAVEHAAIGIFPLLVMADRNDLGGISIPFHSGLKRPAIFIYDGIPGGAGLSRQAFQRADDLLTYTFETINACPCKTGCPACVHSPKCGSGNRPIDKAAALFILTQLQTRPDLSIEQPRPQRKLERHHPPSTLSSPSKHPRRFKPRTKPKRFRIRNKPKKRLIKTPNVYYGVFDLETQKSAQEVGGWHNAHRMKVSCGVVYDSGDDRFHTYKDHEVTRFIEHLKRFELVVGFNIRRFDYHVLSGYSTYDFNQLQSLDILEKIHRQLGYRLSLDHLAKVTLNSEKSATGLLALKWWKEGKIDKIVEYCRKDVEITKELYLYGRRSGYLLFNNKAGRSVRVPVQW